MITACVGGNRADANVVVAALRSAEGASAEVLDRCLAGKDLAVMGAALFAQVHFAEGGYASPTPEGDRETRAGQGADSDRADDWRNGADSADEGQERGDSEADSE